MCIVTRFLSHFTHVPRVLNFRNSAFCPHSVYNGLRITVRIKVTVSLNVNKKKCCVFLEMRTEILTHCPEETPIFKGLKHFKQFSILICIYASHCLYLYRIWMKFREPTKSTMYNPAWETDSCSSGKKFSASHETLTTRQWTTGISPQPEILSQIL
jgi:hypothetical protein